MKIWFPTIRAGTGADVYIINLAKGLNKNGIETEITWFPKFAEIFPHPLHYAKVPKDVDIIHTNSWYGFALSKMNIPCVVSVFHWVHDPVLLPYKSLMQKIYHNQIIKQYEIASIENAASVIAISKYTEGQLKRSFPEKIINIVNTGVDINLFKPSEIKHHDAQDFNLFFTGTPSRRKGFDLLSSIMEKLPERVKLLYTDGYIDNEKAKKIGKLTLSQLINTYQSCDAVLFPSRYEGFGYVVAEAMACGKPVVTSNCSAIPELVENMKTGILCPLDDVQKFVDSIIQLYKNRELAKSLGLAARKRIVKDYSIDTMINGYIKIYNSIN